MTISNEYAEEMKRRHDNKDNWGNSAIRFGGFDVVGLVARYSHIRSVLDYGCGKGILEAFVKEQFPNRPLEWHNYDPGMKGWDTLPKGKCDLVVTCDVLEHVEPHLTDQTILELESKCGLVMYNNIACSKTGSTFRTGPYIGENIHLNVQTPLWWKERFDAVLASEKTSLYEYRDVSRRAKVPNYRARCTLIHEIIG